MGARASYSLPDGQLVYDVDNAGLKESILLNDQHAAASYSFSLHTGPGLTAQARADGSIAFLDRSGKAVFGFSAPVMEDSSHTLAGHSHAVSLTLGSQGTTDTLAADPHWLTDPSRVYPVTIDPTFTLIYQTFQGATDCSQWGPPNDNTNECNYIDDAVGYVTSPLRTLLQFSPSIPANSVVQSAQVGLHQSGQNDTTTSVPVGVYAVTRGWSRSATYNTYDGSNAWSTAGGDFGATQQAVQTVSPSNGWDYWYPTQLVQGWVDGSIPNNGLILKEPTENVGNVLYFDDSESATSSNWPSLQIFYQPPIGARSFSTFAGRDIHDGLSLEVNVATGNLVAQASDLALSGVGLPMAIGRAFNSFNAGTNTDLGNGWRMGTGGDVALIQWNDGSASVQEPGGYQVPFQRNADGSFGSPPGVDATLSQNGSAFTLTDNRSQEQLIFNGGELTAARDRSGNTLTFGYDSTGNQPLSSITDTLGRVTSVATNASGEITTVTDPTGRSIQYGYDGSNNLTSSTDANNKVMQYAYGSNFQLTQITDPNNAITTVAYDGTGRVASITDPMTTSGVACGSPGCTTTFTYNNGSTVVTDSNQHSTTYTYDRYGRVTATTDSLNHTSQQSWNADDQITSTTSPLNHTTTFSYDSLNNPTGEQLPNGQTFRRAYTNSTWPYQPSSQTDEEGRTTTYGYNNQGLQNSVTDTITGYSDSSIYNANGTLASKTDANGHTTQYSYFGATNCSTGTIAGFLSRVDYPSSSGQASPLGSDTYTYDCTGRLSSSQDGKGQRTSYTYDQFDRPTGVSYNDNTSQFFQYDADGNQTQLDDYSPTTGHAYTGYAYNPLGQETQKALPNGHSISYTYDGEDNLLTKIDGGGMVTYAYNADDTSASVTDPQGARTTFAYDADARQTGMTYPNGVTETSSYDNSDQLTQIAATKSGTQLTSFNYSYTNPATNTYTNSRYSVSDMVGNVTRYGYDGLARLTSAVQKTSGGVTLHAWSYRYDPVGNMTTINGSTASYNVVDQLTGMNGHAYNYDLNGNQLSSTSGNTLAYNTQDQTSSITPSGGSAIPITYTDAGQGGRIGSGTTGYQYDQNGLSASTPSGDSSATSFTTTPDGDVLSERIPGGSTGCALPGGQWCAYYYLHDGLGSIVNVLDSSGTVQNSYTYDPYGNAYSVTENVPNPFRYIGALWDASTGLYKMSQRYYDPSIGRFTQTDPISTCAGSTAQYTYANEDPVNQTDAQGTSSAHYSKKRKHKRHHSRSRPKPTPTNTPVPLTTPAPHSSFRQRFASCLGESIGEISDACLGACVRNCLKRG